MKLLLSVCLAALALVSLFPSRALACACCAEKGEYYISTEKPDTYKLGLLEEMKFDDAAELYMNEAGFDGIKGLKSIEKDYDANDWTATPDFFNLSGVFAAKTWKLNFKTKTGKTGTLVLPVPAQMLSFKADLHDTPEDTEVAVYKEWRFKGVVQSGNGFLGASIVKPTTYFLVLQGRGNNCDNAEDFKYWRLEITGRNAGYAFFGKLK
ncbi:MAG: hypothetical protein JSS81_03030 [Acidobacteria bacterium]|nr:hypothetical protein [Acidobacteriota bacterium]